MTSLSSRLGDWVAAGLISAPQADSIAAHEAARPLGNWLIFSFLALASGVIGIGVISLISANWHQIPDETKLALDFLLLAGLASGFWRQADQRDALSRELLLSLFVLGCLASIGLIGQIYHANGRWDQALLFWAAITLPMVSLSQRRFMPMLWTTAVLVAVSYGFAVSPWFNIFWIHPDRWQSMLFALPLLSATVALVLQRLPAAEAFTESFESWIWLSGLFAVTLTDFTRVSDLSISSQSLDGYLPGLGFGLMVMVGIGVHPQWSIPRKMLMGFLLILYVAMIPICLLWRVHHWISAVFVVAIFGAVAIHLGLTRHPRLSNLLILLLGGRFLLLFLMAFGGLALTGVGLILSGLLILGLIWLWMRLRQPLQTWLEALAP
ncbi:DUF2157 domain-containing protein [Gammaproteobacteria bacterium]